MNIQDLKTSLRNDIIDATKILKLSGINPRMAVVLVGDESSSVQYIEKKSQQAEKLGITIEKVLLEKDTTQKELHEHLRTLSLRKDIHGIILESPLPSQLDYTEAMRYIDSKKDIDGLSEANLGKIQTGDLENALISATPLACMMLLDDLVENITGKYIVIVGRGRTVGKPLSGLLIHRGATVTVANSHTKNLEKICQNADIIISATGKKGLIGRDHVHTESIIIDAGTIYDSDGKLCGDVDFYAVEKIVKYVSPVPGGVGVLTPLIVFKNLLKAIELQREASDFDLSVDNFIEIASGSSLPGGGGIAAIVGILGVAMASMVLTISKNENIPLGVYDYMAYIKNSLRVLYKKDIVSFQSYLSALHLPRDTPEQKTERKYKLQSALIESSLVCIELSDILIGVYEHIDTIIQYGNKHVISDAYVSARLISTAIRSAFDGFNLNMRSIIDSTRKQELEDIKFSHLHQVAQWEEKLKLS